MSETATGRRRRPTTPSAAAAAVAAAVPPVEPEAPARSATVEPAAPVTSSAPAGSAAPAAPVRTEQRRHILDRALDLMSQRGSMGTSMRQLADACGLNVATIYHYFPSKAVLLQALIEQQRYGQRLSDGDPPLDATLPARDRLARLLTWLWSETAAEHAVLRLILGEGVRGDATAQRSARRLITALDAQLAGWMAQGFPELADRGIDPAGAGRLVRRHLLALVAETLVADPPASAATVSDQDLGTTAADDLATALFP